MDALDFGIDDNFKRLKSDLIPKENCYFDIDIHNQDQEDKDEEEFCKVKNQIVKSKIKQERKHSV